MTSFLWVSSYPLESWFEFFEDEELSLLELGLLDAPLDGEELLDF